MQFGSISLLAEGGTNKSFSAWVQIPAMHQAQQANSHLAGSSKLVCLGLHPRKC
jgi:hypothetical protein